MSNDVVLLDDTDFLKKRDKLKKEQQEYLDKLKKELQEKLEKD